MSLTRVYLIGVLTGLVLGLAAYGVRLYELRIERLELHVAYIEGFLEQATGGGGAGVAGVTGLNAGR